MTEAPAALLATVADLSRRFGSDPGFARAGGGNSSGKAEGVLWIKPSGVSLASITPASLMPLAMAPLLEALQRHDLPGEGSEAVLQMALAARLDPADRRRPSVECLFHALLPESIVIHTHPTIVNALTCARDGERIAAELFSDEALWIPYTDPGRPLAARIAQERDAFARSGRSAPPVLLLQNHGLIVAGEAAGEIVARSEAVVEAVRRRIGAAQPREPGPGPASAHARDEHLATRVAAALGTLPGRGGSLAVVHDASPPALALATTVAGHDLVRGGPLTPDEIVYAGIEPVLVERLPDAPGAAVDAVTGSAARRLERSGPPAVIVAAGLGVFAIAETPRLAEAARDVYLDAWAIAQGAARLGGTRPMAPAERRFIEAWEAEAYRRGITAGST